MRLNVTGVKQIMFSAGAQGVLYAGAPEKR